MKIFLILLMLVSTSAFAEFIDCKKGVGKFGNLGEMRYQIGQFPSNGTCFVSIGPRNSYPLYRDYSFYSDGEMMIFNSLGDGRPSQDTGARNFLFPVRTHKLAFELDHENEYIRVRNTDGRTWAFDARSSKVDSIERMKFIVDPDVNRRNNGGVELTPEGSGTLIDEGWRVGGPPNIVLSRKSTIKDSFGNECSVKNKYLFKLDIDDSGSVDGAIFIHNTEAKWKSFLDKKCRNIEL